MFAILSDERKSGRMPEAATGGDDRTAAILDRAQEYRAALAPTRRESDMGVVISVLAVTAYEDFDRSVTA